MRPRPQLTELCLAGGLDPEPPLPGAKPRGLRLNWEAYPNCAVYDAPGGPAAGAWNVKGAVAKGCKGYAECVYEGSALPALPVLVEEAPRVLRRLHHLLESLHRVPQMIMVLPMLKGKAVQQIIQT